MESVQNVVTNASETVSSFLSNTWVTAFVFMFVLVFASAATPKLPTSVAQLFQYTWVKVLFIALILYMNQINSGIAILLAIIFFFGLQSLSQVRMFDFMDKINEKAAELKKKYEEMTNPDAKAQLPVARHLTTYDPNMTDFDGDEQVTGLAERAPYYSGPQGMGQPSGYGVSLTGAEIQYE